MRPQIIENQSDDTVTVDGRKMAGWIAEDANCVGCKTQVVFSLSHLARFCPGCNSWLDRHCEDAECLYCSGRPARPLAA
jgi:hypothetical protein